MSVFQLSISNCLVGPEGVSKIFQEDQDLLNHILAQFFVAQATPGQIKLSHAIPLQTTAPCTVGWWPRLECMPLYTSQFFLFGKTAVTFEPSQFYNSFHYLLPVELSCVVNTAD